MSSLRGFSHMLTIPSKIRCCTKAPCSGGDGCRWKSDCAGTSLTGRCPGPTQFQCCTSSATGFGGYGSPSIPAVGACRSVAVAGARAIVNAFPGRVREVFCIRNCACPGTSDHCCGKATDMVSCIAFAEYWRRLTARSRCALMAVGSPQ